VRLGRAAGGLSDLDLLQEADEPQRNFSKNPKIDEVIERERFLHFVL
jgi:hypothetical protein